MAIVESLARIRPTWVSRVSSALASAEGVRVKFLQQLNRFYDLLQQAVESGNAARINPILSEWIETRTQSDLQDPDSSLPLVLNKILLLTFEIAREELPEPEAMAITGAVLPVYTHALALASAQETQLHVRHVSVELERVKTTLERLEKSKSDFIAIAAHELKTPLTLIDGYASMLREMLPIELSKDTHISLYLRGIDAGTRRLREIVDDMIDVSVIDNDLLSLNFQPVWINRLLGSIQRDMADSVQEMRQILDVRTFPGCDEMTFGDGERLLQAFRNVISNAVKYTPDQGKIVVDGRLLPGFVEVTISDTGIGIDPDDHARIFEKFGRLGDVALHSSGKTKFKGGGPGLGLPITKGIIEAHGGAIWVESEGYDEARCPGSIFHILLPILKQPPDDKAARLFGPLIGGDRHKLPHGKKNP